jgi:hypothetical protein
MAGELEAARTAYQAALKLQPGDAEMQHSLRSVNAQAGHVLALEPVARVSGDSDGNRTSRTGIEAVANISDHTSLGLAVTHVRVTDDVARVSGWEGLLSGEWQPQRALRFETRAGAVQVMSAGGDVVKGVAHARLRWRPEHGIAVDIRARHEPIAVTPRLYDTQIVLSELRATIDVPVVAAMRVRGFGRVGRLSDPFTANRRTSFGAGPVLRLAPASELSAGYARTRYARPSEAGYFAPSSIESIDAGAYHEHYALWPLTIALDLGGGVERATLHGAERASWQRALHLWSQASWAIADRSELALEIEAYESRIGDATPATTGQWRWASVALSARIAT